MVAVGEEQKGYRKQGQREKQGAAEPVYTRKKKGKTHEGGCYKHEKGWVVGKD
jgi:hypothetical protein